MPYTIDPEETVEFAIRLQHEHDIRHLPVCLNNEVIGMVSDRDLRSYLPPLRGYDEQSACTDRLRPLSSTSGLSRCSGFGSVRARDGEVATA